MNQFVITEEIWAKTDVVWKILADVERWHEWSPSIQKITPMAYRAMGVGARYRVIQPKLAPMVYEVTAFEPGHQFTWEAKSIGIRVVGEHWIFPSSVRDHVLLKLVLRREGFLAPLVHLFWGKLTRDYVTTEAKGLRSRAESQ
jgi:hypothetical protein